MYAYAPPVLVEHSAATLVAAPIEKDKLLTWIDRLEASINDPSPESKLEAIVKRKQSPREHG